MFRSNRGLRFSVRMTSVVRTFLFLEDKMNYNYNQNYNQSPKPLTPKAIIVFIVVFISLVAIIVSSIISIIGNSEKKKDEEVDTHVYIGETLSCDDIDVTVNNITGQLYEGTNVNYQGLVKLTVNLTCKNNSKQEFEISSSDFHLKTMDTEELYDVHAFSGSSGVIFDFGDDIIAGATKTYDIEFYVPHKLEDNKQYILCISWSFFSVEKEYYLYNRDGSNAITKIEQSVNEKEIKMNEIGRWSNGIEFTVFDCKETTEIKSTLYHFTTDDKFLIIKLRVYNGSPETFASDGTDVWLLKDNIKIHQVDIAKRYQNGYYDINQGATITKEYDLFFEIGKDVSVNDLKLVINDGERFGSESIIINLENAPKNN